MPLKNKSPELPEREPIENLKDLIGFKWSSVIKWLIALIPSAFFLGFAVGKWVAYSDNKLEMSILIMKHNQELNKATEEGRKKGLEEYKQVTREKQTC